MGFSNRWNRLQHKSGRLGGKYKYITARQTVARFIIVTADLFAAAKTVRKTTEAVIYLCF